MTNSSPAKSPTLLLTGIALAGWFAIAAQFYLMIKGRKTSVTEISIRFFSFFTILTNILVAVTSTLLALKSRSATNRFLSRPNNLTAITVYIVVVGLVYNLVLRSLWKPQELQRIVDELLHSAIPLAFLFYWLLFVPKRELQWKHVFPWMLYPLFYLGFILLRGAYSGFYPYPFVNVKHLGYGDVAFNCLLMTLVFLGFGFALMGIAKIGRKKG